jgi:Right handed beta helix region
MTRLMLLCAWLCAMAFVVAANPAQALNTISYVSNTGSNSNNCSSPAQACADFPTALAATVNYGEIDCVNAGLYNIPVLTISQSVTIDCAGGVGSTNGTLTVNGAGIVVRLRNMSFNNFGLGAFGIDAKNMAALYVENCVITNYNAVNNSGNPPYLGIKFEPSANSLLFVTNSVISDSGKSGSSPPSGGIYIVPASGVTATVSIDRSQINGNIFGIIADGTSGGIIKGTITDSVVSGNSQNGITVSSSGSSVVLQVDRATAASNGNHGLAAAGSNAGMLVSNSNVFNNGGGLFSENGAALYSYGNNHVNGNNGNDGTFTGTVGQQ